MKGAYITTLTGNLGSSPYFCIGLVVAGKERLFRVAEWEYAEILTDLFGKEIEPNDPRIKKAFEEALKGE